MWGAVAALSMLAAGAPASAKAIWLKKAQAEDPRIESCLGCHLTKKGKDLNARGQWLVDRRAELGVKEIDFKWLKEYKEPEEPAPAPPESKPSEGDSKPAEGSKP
jgi:hypothetical protein